MSQDLMHFQVCSTPEHENGYGYMRRYYVERIDHMILMALHVFSFPEYEKFVLECCLSACMYG
jgi:hypothetical protein